MRRFALVSDASDALTEGVVACSNLFISQVLRYVVECIFLRVSHVLFDVF